MVTTKHSYFRNSAQPHVKVLKAVGTACLPMSISPGQAEGKQAFGTSGAENYQVVPTAQSKGLGRFNARRL